MNVELKQKTQLSIDALLPMHKRILHQIKCVKLGRLLALQNDQLMKQIIYNQFKST